MLKKKVYILAILLLTSFGVKAQLRESSANILARSLGFEISLAAMKNAVGETQAETDKTFNEAQLTAKQLGITLVTLPARTGDYQTDRQQNMNYLLDSVDKPVEKILLEDYGYQTSAVFDISLNANLLYWLYSDGDFFLIKSMAPPTIEIIEIQTKIADIPEAVTSDVVKLSRIKPTKILVKNAVFAMHDKVFKFVWTRDLTARGDIFSGEKKYTEALEAYTKAISLDANFAEAYFKRGMIYNLIVQDNLAAADFTRFIQLAPIDKLAKQNLSRAYYNRGISYLNLGSNVKAAGDFSQAIIADPKYANAYYNRGVVRQKLGQINLSKLDFQKAEALEPGIGERYSAKN